MLASITPLGERGRGSRWALTVAAFALAATAAGAVAGVVLGALGSLVLPDSLGTPARLLLLAVLALAALIVDVAPGGVPGPRRQVDERWRDEYRGWVYGAGYGAQLGLGITTVVSSASTYLAFAAAFLSGGTARGALILGVFGALRGVQPLAAAGVRRPDQLLRAHRRLTRWREPARLIGILALLGIAVGAGTGGLA